MDEKMVGYSNKITLPASLIDFNRSGQLTAYGNMALSWDRKIHSILKVLKSSRIIQTALLDILSWNFLQTTLNRNTTTIMTIVSNVSMLLPFTTTAYYVLEGLEWHQMSKVFWYPDEKLGISSWSGSYPSSHPGSFFWVVALAKASNIFCFTSFSFFEDSFPSTISLNWMALATALPP